MPLYMGCSKNEISRGFVLKHIEILPELTDLSAEINVESYRLMCENIYKFK